MLLSQWLSVSQRQDLYRYTLGILIIAYQCTDNLTDINECSANNGICGNDKICFNTIGSYSCVCQVGYRQLSDGTCQGTDRSMRYHSIKCFISSDVNECSTPNICGVNKQCVNTAGSYTCRCNSGYKERRNGNCEGSHSRVF